MSDDEVRTTSFAKASKANSKVEKNRTRIAEEEQELLYGAPYTTHIPAINVPQQQQLVANAAAQQVLDTGLVHFPSVLDPALATALRNHVDTVLVSSQNQVIDATNGAKYLDLFGPIMSRTARYDLLLPCDELVLECAQHILKIVGPTMQKLVGDEGYLCELTALISDPTAEAQPIHHDTSFDGCPPRISLLVALQDVTEEMGPTMFFPSTNSPEWHMQYIMRGEDMEEMMCNEEHVRACMLAGDAVLYDTTTLHCASANVSQQRRVLLTLSAQEEDRHNKNVPVNILKQLRRTMQLKNVDTWVVAEEK